MKYITFTVPCYNSESYMERCIESLLPAGEKAEIIIINDGSADATGEIAAAYEKRYPTIVRAVNQENGGHGSGVNRGLSMAQGVYFKVVDSDDWLDKEALGQLMERLEQLIRQGDEAALPDLFICNYCYDHLYEGTRKEMRFGNVFPEGKMCGWNDIGHFLPSQYLVMHALIFRTSVLRASGVKLPEHTFYVDNIFANQPLAYADKLYYMDIGLYHYFLGREDQSVNEQVLIRRIDQQIKVTKIVSHCVDLDEVEEKHPKLAAYLRRNISIMLSISSIHLLLIGTREALDKRNAMWRGLREYDKKLYRRIRYGTISGFTYLPGRFGNFLTLAGYRAAKRIYRFN